MRPRSLTRPLVLSVTTTVLALVLVGAGPLPAAEGLTATADWAPASEASIRPGAQTFTDGAQCTANFVFTDAGSDAIYLGQAAHCAGTDGATATDGCDAGSLPLGTDVEIEGASQPGTLVYSSWLTMQDVGEGDAATCAFNDFALVRVDPADIGDVNPTVPFWGGPTSLGADAGFGERVHSYGSSSLRLGLDELSPKEGYVVGEDPSGWSRDVYTLTPGVPGDSGSAFLASDGAALGVLVTLQVAPLAGSNGVTDLAKAVAYTEAHTDLDVDLALGTEAFTPGLLPSL